MATLLGVQYLNNIMTHTHTNITNPNDPDNLDIRTKNNIQNKENYNSELLKFNYKRMLKLK